MVAFCAIYIIQSINQSTSDYLSDWSLFRLATLQERVAELERQAVIRQTIGAEDSMSVVDAMARQISRGIRLIINRKHTRLPPPLPTGIIEGPDPFGATMPSTSYQDPFEIPQGAHFDGLFSDISIPTLPEWSLESLLPEMTFLWDTNHLQDPVDMQMFDFSQSVSLNHQANWISLNVDLSGLAHKQNINVNSKARCVISCHSFVQD